MRTLVCAAMIWRRCAPGDRSRTSAAADPRRSMPGRGGAVVPERIGHRDPWRMVTAVVQDGSLRGP